MKGRPAPPSASCPFPDAFLTSELSSVSSRGTHCALLDLPGYSEVEGWRLGVEEYVEPLGLPPEDGHGVPQQLTFLVLHVLRGEGPFTSHVQPFQVLAETAYASFTTSLLELQRIFRDELTHGLVSPSIELFRP